MPNKNIHSLKAIYNLSTQTWSFEYNKKPFDYLELFVAFRLNDEDYPEDGKYVIFDNLSFGVTQKLKDENLVISSKTWPEEGLIYQSTDQDWIESYRFLIPAINTTYTFTLWAENAGVKSENTFELVSDDYFANALNYPTYKLPWE